MITGLELSGYNRFFLNNIQSILYTPVSPIQLILGSNGSGKSSLLKELNPLPINKHEFKEDGYKRFKRTKDNNNYEIYSDKSKCNFLYNDKELNPGGTKKIQLALIQDHFNLNVKNNNVLLNISKLSTMSTNERKDWLRQMSTVDYSYGIFLYNEVKQKLRDSIGFIKIINNELAEDTKLVIKEEELDSIKNEIITLKEIIEDLTSKYTLDSGDIEDIKPDYESIKQFDILMNKGINKFDRNEILVKLNSINIKDLDTEIDKIQKEIDNIEIINKTSEEIENIKKSLAEYHIYFENINNYFKEEYNILESLELYNKYQSELQNLSHITLELSYQDDIQVTKDIYKEVVTKKENILFKLNKLTKDKIRVDSEYKILMDNFKDENKITCNNCGTEQYFGYDKNKQLDLEKRIPLLEKDIEALNLEYEKIMEELGKYDKKINLIKILKETYLGMNLLNYWNINLQDVIGTITSTQMHLINNKLGILLETTKDYKVRNEEYQDLMYKLKVDTEILELQNKHMENNKDRLLNKLNEYLEIRRESLSKIEHYTNLLKDVDNFILLKERFLNVISKHSNNKNKIVIKNRNNIIKTTINKLKETLLHLEDKYNNFDRIKSRINKNKELVEKYEKNKTLLELTVKALSPNEGLIAKSINGFINKFLTEMNAIINSVWSYDITLLPCQINDENDLDYKFRVLIDNQQEVEDVSMLSSSMKDIVDLSFRIIFMKYMHLEHEPLILDEFGITMDDKHRHSVYHIIENTLANNFSQLFITAHFKSMYGRFLDSDIVVLDDRNIDLEAVSYNTNIKII